MEPQKSPPADPAVTDAGLLTNGTEDAQTFALREEQLVAFKEPVVLGEVVIRREIEEIPGEIAVERFVEQVEQERVPINRVVAQRTLPWEEEGVLIVPIYEERLRVVKELVLTEQIRIKRVKVVEEQVYREPLLRDRLHVDVPSNVELREP